MFDSLLKILIDCSCFTYSLIAIYKHQILILSVKMETKPTKKKPIVYKDESFLENINLVTGNKINFERTLSVIYHIY